MLYFRLQPRDTPSITYTTPDQVPPRAGNLEPNKTKAVAPVVHYNLIATSNLSHTLSPTLWIKQQPVVYFIYASTPPPPPSSPPSVVALLETLYTPLTHKKDGHAKIQPSDTHSHRPGARYVLQSLTSFFLYFVLCRQALRLYGYVRTETDDHFARRTHMRLIKQNKSKQNISHRQKPLIN